MPQDLLIKKMNEYDKLYNINILIEVETLGVKNQYTIGFSTYGYPHMIGLGKYTSIDLLKKLSEKKIKAKDVIRYIKKNKISYEMLEKTGVWDNRVNGSLLKERIDTFDYDSIINLMQQKIIVYFNKSVLNTEFDADFIIFDVKLKKYYHLSMFYKDRITKANNLVVSSYFIDETTRYLDYQRSAKINKISVIDKKSKDNIISKEFIEKTS